MSERLRLRPYIAIKDFDTIKNWIIDERTHAMWCANLTSYPIEKNDFEKLLDEVMLRFGDSPFVVTSKEGSLIGFFCYSLNLENNEGMLKFVMVNPDIRGKGYGKAMLQLAIKYAFEMTKASAVHLNVFPENVRAKKCYEAVGFIERKLDKDAYKFKDELWGRCNMVMTK